MLPCQKKFVISLKSSLASLCHLAFVCWYFKSTNSKMVSNVHFNLTPSPVIQPLKLHLDLSPRKVQGARPSDNKYFEEEQN